MLSRNIGRVALARLDPAWPFRSIAGELAAADVAFINLESPFCETGKPSTRGMIFRTSPRMVEGLELAGIDVASTANNHVRDCGSQGLEFTYRWLSEHGVTPVGTALTAEQTFRGAVLERRGVRFGFLAYTYDQRNGNHRDDDSRVSMLEMPQMQRDVSELKTRADVIVVSMHAGWEYRKQPNRQQLHFARAAIDAGASLVAGHHPHVRQRAEEYHGGLIFYSLGNLVFDQFHRQETQVGSLAEITFSGRDRQQWRLLTVRMHPDAVTRVEEAESSTERKSAAP